MKKLCLLLILSTKTQSLTNYSNYLQQLKAGPTLTINKCGQESFSDQSNECETLIKEYEDTRNEMWDIHKNPSKYELSDESFLNGEADKLINDKLDQLYDIGNQCLKKRFTTCYPDLNETVDLDTLNTIYNDLKNDHSFRMKDPMAACYERAKRLGFKLAEQGYKTEIIHIEDAPTLIAPLLDAKDNYLDGFHDYYGQHYVIAIKSSDGNSYILDPQFSEVPLKKENYFMKTTGPICVNANLSKNDAGIWGCTYQNMT
jgi:hypothetical protein